MEAPRGGLVVEQLTPVRHRIGFEELAGLSQGQPVSVGVTNADLFPDDASAAAFAQAVRGASQLSHQHVARTLAVEAAGPRRWAVLWERFEGPTLDRVLAERGTLLPDEAVSITIALSQALATAHDQGVLHGGVAPEWVTLVSGPRGLDTRLAGFGLGQLAAFTGGKKPTVASDLYALGVLLHQLLTGAAPQGKLGALPANAMHLGPVLAKTLGLDAASRYRSVVELETALTEANRTHVSSGKVISAVNAPRPGGIAARTLGPWELLSLLGEGAMGQVFLGKHSLLGRQAAIKVLRPEQYQREDLIQRFFQEARAVNQINHEHIVEISDFGQELGPDGKPSAVYFVMELLQGETLTARLGKGTLPVKRAVHIATQLCDALEAAHRLGVVHRDVKSDNVFLIKRHGDEDYVKVLDFGVAKLTQPTVGAPTVSTMDGAIIGTPTSMSPEQASGGAVDHRADVYAVGVILYQLLAGKLPIDADNFARLVAKLLTEPPAPLPPKTPLGEPIPPELAAVVMRCLAKDPATRPQTMRALIEDLSEPPKLEQPPSRKGLFLAGAVALVAAVGVAVFALRPPPEVVTPVPTEPPPLAVVDAGAPEPIDAGVVAVAVGEVDAGPEEPPDAGAAVAVEEPLDAGAAPVVVKNQRPVKLTNQAILQVVARVGKPGVERCLSSHQQDLPGKTGQLKVAWNIEGSGAVSSVEVVNPPPGSAELQRCVVRSLEKMKFPKNTGVPRLTLPFGYAF